VNFDVLQLEAARDLFRMDLEAPDLAASELADGLRRVRNDLAFAS
jgi:hypothetical protein